MVSVKVDGELNDVDFKREGDEIIVQFHQSLDDGLERFWYEKTLKLPYGINRVWLDANYTVYGFAVEASEIAPNHWKWDDEVIRKENVREAANLYKYHLDSLEDDLASIKRHGGMFPARLSHVRKRLKTCQRVLSDSGAQAAVSDAYPGLWEKSEQLVGELSRHVEAVAEDDTVREGPVSLLLL